MKYAIKLNINKPPVRLQEPEGCELYVATHPRTGQSFIVLDTYKNIIFFSDKGDITHAPKEFLLQEYIIRDFTAQDSLTIQGTN